MTSYNPSLFDISGPRSQRSARVWSTITLIVVAILIYLAVRQLETHGQFAEVKWAPFLKWNTIRYLLGGLRNTIIAGAIASVIALIAGAILSVGRLSKNLVTRYASSIYIETFRSVPVLLMIFFMLIVPSRYGVTISALWQLVIPLAISNAAMMAEIFRAGILAVPVGQTEAGYSVGLTYWRIIRLVVFPQAVGPMTPLIISQLIYLLKDTTLGFLASYEELLFRSKVLGASQNNMIPTFIVIAVVYIIITGVLSKVVRVMENRRRLQRGA